MFERLMFERTFVLSRSFLEILLKGEPAMKNFSMISLLAVVLGVCVFLTAGDALAQRGPHPAPRPAVRHPAKPHYRPAPPPRHRPAPPPPHHHHHHPAPPHHHHHYHPAPPPTWGGAIGAIIDAAIYESHRP